MKGKIQLKNGTSLFVNYKKQNGPAILFLHFSGGTSGMWSSVLKQFEDHFTVIAPDMRGHGQSDKPVFGYHIDDMADDVYELLQELEIKSCHIVGSSMGAEVGLSLAARYPERVESLVCEGGLYNEFGEYGLFNGREEEIALEKGRLSKQLNERKMPVFPTKQAFVENMSQSLKEHGLETVHFLPFVESCADETEDGTFTSHYRNFVRTEYIQKYWELKFEEYYKQVSCPILFLPSTEEWENEKIRHSFEYFSSFVDQYEIHHIPDSMHAYVWMQQPEVAGEVVRSFIARVANQEV